ncbi:hypothetical protein COLO4_27831 [Corchorus olitorius]|uniref:Malectin-like domain-containing protein n=1 Tax=Corchorus olitorius TaxID=93759 RepID=A0A1R3HNY1_9ROSI|nr:hypothetical protein COLO4_27831 [Corchorus olitorius]
MPLHLYTRGDDVPIPFVGFLPNMLTVDNNSALEMVYRANVGGQTIPPDQDTGMFRTWNADESYIFGAAYGQIDFDNTLSIQYPKTVPAYTAPGDVYRTARSMVAVLQVHRHRNLLLFEKRLPRKPRQEWDNPLISKKHVIRIAQFSFRLESLIICLELRILNHFANGYVFRLDFLGSGVFGQTRLGAVVDGKEGVRERDFVGINTGFSGIFLRMTMRLNNSSLPRSCDF